jgi:1-acyl-sn-glycerol-3-phosphate acyltransferase
MAIRAQVPLVPMALIGTHELLPIHTLQFYPVPITIVVGEPIETTNYTMRQIDELTQRLSDEICRLYYQHSYLQAPDHPSLEAITTEIPENAV